MNPQQIEFTLDAPGQRLDKALATTYPEQSRTAWQRLIDDGNVIVDGKTAKASQRLEGGETVVAYIPEPVEVEIVPEDIPLEVVYEDYDIIVVNKSAGMVVHPAVGHESGTLVNAILALCPDIEGVGGEIRPGIVHRLDKDTSGLIVVAKNGQALRTMQEQFKNRTIEKIYLALVDGNIQPSEALIDAPIGRHKRHRKRMAVIPEGRGKSRTAQTRYRTIQRYDEYSLLECRPLTGRTHQIRVHLAYIGYPIVGDSVYGRRKQRIKLSRHFLHATVLSFNLPKDGQRITLQTPLPGDLQTVLDKLRSPLS